MGIFAEASNSNELWKIEDDARRADLRILRTPMLDIPNLDITSMTAGELITLSEVYAAINSIANHLRETQTESYGRKPSYETRNRASGPYDDITVPTVNGDVRYADIPKDPAGLISQEWIAANCECDNHVRERAEAAGKRGMYL